MEQTCPGYRYKRYLTVPSQNLIREIEENKRKENEITEKRKNVLRYFDGTMDLMKVEYEKTKSETRESL